jgi:hypothetical protein
MCTSWCPTCSRRHGFADFTTPQVIWHLGSTVCRARMSITQSYRNVSEAKSANPIWLTKWFWEQTNFYVAYVEMTKYCTKISLFTTQCFSFLRGLQEMSVFHEIVWEHIECGDIHKKKIPNFFKVLKFIYRVKGDILMEASMVSIRFRLPICHIWRTETVSHTRPALPHKNRTVAIIAFYFSEPHKSSDDLGSPPNIWSRKKSKMNLELVDESQIKPRTHNPGNLHSQLLIPGLFRTLIRFSQ